VGLEVPEQNQTLPGKSCKNLIINSMKIIETNEISFTYHPVREELTIFCGAKFIVTAKVPKFKVDINPNGQEKVVGMSDITVSEDKQTFIYTPDNIASVHIKTKAETCKMAFATVAMNDLNFSATEDNDKIDLYVVDDRLSHLYLNKTKDYQLIDALRIIRENEILFLVKNKPEYLKEELSDFHFKDKILHINTSVSNHKFSFDTNETIFHLLKMFLRK
jgi:hypothetical protein